ncbi:hypothetical protein GALMADRAFT_211132 [Galerina marginata CBS 339.88]|uniref:Uncharacterized protein n=1 Tax=Galerina marginata (strain CBS 339.88) TaxID=685588 RepID=A0A067T6V6_GALM3|nr:hypothetical protein GALMADRAFT_211132 [Galerina marginata CBS 339.88]
MTAESDSVARQLEDDLGISNSPSSPDVQADDQDVQDDISLITEKIRNIDIDVFSIRRVVEAVPQKTASTQPDAFSESFFLRHARNILGLGTSRTMKSQHAKIDPAVADSQHTLARLTGDRDRLLVDLRSRITLLSRRNATHSSQTRLPVELWAQIFFLCLPPDDFVKPDPHDAPLLLCQVCSAWRRVATGTPLLWSTLSIRGSWRRHIWKSSLECWLRRSGNAVLYLDISIPEYLEPTFDVEITKLILSSADRWYHLRLSLPDNLLRSMLNATHMPMLHKLEFSSTYPIAPLEIQTSQAPQLRTVSLLTKSLYPQPLSLPWNQLTNVSSQCWLNIGQHLEILRKCPRLETYCMCLVHADIPPDARPVLMHHLRRLEIVAFIGSAMGPVLSRLQLPNLTQLTFIVPSTSPACGVSGWPKVYVMSLVERSSCLLQNIRLKGIDIAEESIRDTKKSIPSLISVDVL